MKNLNKVKTIFFDLDHTLWDFDRNSSLAFKHIFNIYDFPFSHSEFLKWYVPINHKYWRDYSENKISKEKLRIRSLQKTFNCLNFNYKAEYINEISNEYIKTLPTKTFLFEGVIDLLEKLKPIYDGDTELRKAMKLIAETGKGPKDQIPSMGCSIKWFN